MHRAFCRLAPSSRPFLQKLARQPIPFRPFPIAKASSMSAAPAYFLLEYKYVSDILEKRGPFRAAHLAAAQEKAEKGNIVLAGAVGNPVEGALFVFKNQTVEEITGFVTADPYVINGLVPSWTIKPYTVVASAAQ